MATGACNCGEVSFEISADIKDVYVCHCSICQRATGNNGAAVLVIPNEDFIWTAGENFISSWKKPDAKWETWFCRQCGSFVPGTNDDSHMFIPAGTIIDGGEKLAIAHHIWVDSKAAWDELGEAGRRHAQDFIP